MSAESIWRGFFKVRGVSEPMLRSATHIRGFLCRMTQKLDMTLLNLNVVPVYGTEPHLQDEGGLTGVAIISTSHVAIHTWPEERAANVDIYSCKEWEPHVAVQVIRECFTPQAILGLRAGAVNKDEWWKVYSP